MQNAKNCREKMQNTKTRGENTKCKMQRRDLTPTCQNCQRHAKNESKNVSIIIIRLKKTMLTNILVDDSELRRSAKKVQSDNTASFPATSNSEPRRTILAVCSLKVQFLPPVWDIWMLPWPNQGSCCAFICVNNISLRRPKYFEFFEQDNRIPKRRSLW